MPDNLSRLTLPPYSPEPCVAKNSPGLFSERSSPVENVWAYLRANKRAISVFESYDDIADACCNAWNPPCQQE